MISNTEIHEAVLKAQPALDKIHYLYQKLPETTCTCEEPGRCCAFLPEMTLMEALQWIHVMQQIPGTERVALNRKFAEFYLTNPVRHIGCPFLSKGHCGIYEYRTFACRAYGLWSQSLGRERTQQSRKGTILLVKMWQRYGIEIATEAVAEEMDYCDRVGCQSGLKITDNQLMAILQEIYFLDNELSGLHIKFENEYHSDFSFLITSLALGTKKAILGKFAVIKELCREGSDKRLQYFLSRIESGGVIPMD